MDQPRKPSRRTIVRSLVLLTGGIALGALWRPSRRDATTPDPDPARLAAPVPLAPPAPEPRRRALGSRLSVAATFVMLFAAGGALSAFGGNELALLAEDSTPAPPAETTVAAADPTVAAADPTTAIAEPAPSAPVAEDPAPVPAADEAEQTPHELAAEQSAAAPAAPVATAPETAPDPAPAPAPEAPQPVAVHLPVHVAAPAAAPAQPRTPTVARKAAVGVDPEVTSSNAASVIWLDAPLPDPTPPSRRLQRSFVHVLYRSLGSEWPLALAVLRADGLNGRSPAGPLALDALSAPLERLRGTDRGERETAFALLGDVTLADRAEALAHYYRALGTETLVVGLSRSKARLERRVLADPRVSIYPAGRGDVEAGRVDVRVLAVISYLADTFGGVEVSSLVHGHREFARPGVVSAHVYGHAVDVAVLGTTPIAGHQEPGGVTEQAVRALLLLPAELEPKQVISLLGLGGRSLALADHADHIHVGF